MLSLVAIGCAGIGPSGVSIARPAYNTAIQTTTNEEMLLNIVRLRYRDTPFFLQVSGVAANATARAGLFGNAEIPSSGTTVGTVGATTFLEDNPTVTYAPLQGEAFVRHLLTPVRLSTLELLVESGWSIDRVLRLCVQRMGDARNAPSASGPAPDRKPEFETFRRVSGLLRDLEKRDGITFATDRSGLALTFRQREVDSPEAQEIVEALGLASDTRRFVLTTLAQGGGDRPLVFVETRSLMGSLFYLSQAVQPPQEHVEKGWVTVTRNADDSIFAWQTLMDGLFDVRAHPETGSDAFLTVRYLGHTFGIDQRDLDTKATFVLLNQLFALRAGPPGAGGPVLTLPVSR